ncbi:MAG: hypothetical protein ACD_12C00416G0001 [uncultured bacterium]|nr:MAG: hypothetical protein ACD_12C00416G0001 [uncultured bacterium]
MDMVRNKKIVFFSIFIAVLLVFLVAGFLWWQKNRKNELPSNVYSIEVKLDQEKTSQIIKEDGGNLSLKNDDIEFNLNFPKQSVTQNQLISMQKIASISGLDQGAELIAGVELSPQGTVLMAPAELAISSKMENERLIAFAYEENGKNFHFIPLFFEENQAKIQITNFSGYGIINVGDGTYTPPPPESIEAQAQQAIAKVILKAQDRMRTGDKRSLTDEEQNEIYDFLNDWYKKAVRPDLMKSVDNEDLIEPSFNQFNKWRAAIQIVTKKLGFDGDRFKKEIEFSLNQVAKAVANAYVKASQKCTADKDATQIAKMTKWAGFAQYQELDGRSGLDVSDLIDLTKKCAHFELKITSKIESPEAKSTTIASGTLSIGLDENNYFTGGGEIKEESRTEAGFACSYPQGSPVYPVEIIAAMLDTGKGGQRVNLILQFPEEGEDREYDCASTEIENFTTENAGNEWLGNYLLIYHDEKSYIPIGKFEIGDWQIVNSGGIYAKKTVSRTKTISFFGFSGTLIENTTYELIHLPQ